MYLTIMAVREKDDTEADFDLGMERVRNWLKHSNYNGTLINRDPLRLDEARDDFMRLAWMVAQDYPDSADWKDVRPTLVTLAVRALAVLGINPALEETSEDF